MTHIYCCTETFCGLKSSDWVYVFGVLVNAGLAFWIVRTIQNRMTNRRVLKDHFINEVKDLRNEYKTCLSNLYSDKIYPQSVIPWFKLMNIKVNDLMTVLHDKYQVDKTTLQPYQIELRNLITDNDDFNRQFRNDRPVVFSPESKNSFVKFQQDHNNLFNKIIIAVNDAK